MSLESNGNATGEWRHALDTKAGHNEEHWYRINESGKHIARVRGFDNACSICERFNEVTAFLRSELEQARDDMDKQARIILQGSAEIYRHLETISGMQRVQDVQNDALNHLGETVSSLREVIEQKDNLLNGVREIAHSTKHRASLIHEIRQLLPVTTKRP